MNQKPVNKASGLEMVLLRNAFYGDNYRFAKMVLAVLLALNLVLGLSFAYLLANPVKPRYFAVTADGRMIAENPLSQPVVSDDFVLQWTANAVRQTFMLDYVHWQSQLQDASGDYTTDGWHSFVAALQQSNDLNTLTHFHMVADAQLTAAPQIVRREVVDGHYGWNVQMPLLVTFKGHGKTISIPMQVTVIVLRQPVQDYPNRIAINNFIAQTVDPNAVT